jgi:hypothetical protein
MAADDLRRQADQFIDLLEIKDEIGRDPGERETRVRERPQTTPVPASFEDFADI